MVHFSTDWVTQAFRNVNGSIVAGCLAVVSGCVWGTTSLHLARRRRNWLYCVEVAGAVLLVAGVAGQRFFPSDDSVRRLGPGAARAVTSGIWDASIPAPVFGFMLSQVAVIGLVTLAAGAALLLFFEGAHGPANEAIDRLRPLEADDAN